MILLFATLVLIELEPSIDLLVHDLMDLLNDGISLLSQDIRNVNIVDVFHNLALHHSASIVILNVAFPPAFWHIALLVKPLLFEKLCSIVVSVS